METSALGLPAKRFARRTARIVRRAAAARRVRTVGTPGPMPRQAPAAAHTAWLWALPFALLSLWILRRFIEPLA